MRKLFLHSTVCIVIAVIWVTGCNSGNKHLQASNHTRYGGTLNYRIASSPKTLNYLLADDDASLLVAFYLIGGRLVEYNPENNQYIPALAESLQRAKDRKQADVVLRPDIKFSDGTPITAYDVEFTLRALYDPKTASPIFGSAMMINGKKIQAEILNDRCIRLLFPEPVAAPESFLSNLAILPKHILEPILKNGTFNDSYNLTTNPSNIVTSGPFTVRAINSGVSITLRRNPYYWKRDAQNNRLPYLNELIVKVTSDANNALARFENGYIDIYDRLRPTDYSILKMTPASHTTDQSNDEGGGGFSAMFAVRDTGPGLDPDYLWFNLNSGISNGKPIVDPIKKAWFADPRFRRALSYAIDRETLAMVTLQGLATPLGSIVTPANRIWATNVPAMPYDTEMSKTLLREAGFVTHPSSSNSNRTTLYDLKGNRVEFTLMVPAESQARKNMATVIQEEAAKLGISIKVAFMEFEDLQNRIFRTFEYDAILHGAIISEPDPSSYVNILNSKSESCLWNPKQASPSTQWEAQLDKLLAEQAREPDIQRRKQLFGEVQIILAEQQPLIPIVARHRLSAAKRNIGNFKPSSFIPYSLWNADELYMQ